MWRLVRSTQIFQPRTYQQQLASLLSYSSPFSGVQLQRSFSSTPRSQEETEVENLTYGSGPWLMLKPEIDNTTGDVLERFYSPAQNRWVKLNRRNCLNMSNSAYCVGSTFGSWLSYVDPNDCSVYLTEPYMNEVVQLPSLTTLPSVLDVQRDPRTGAVISLHVKYLYEYDQCDSDDEYTKWYNPKWVAKHMVSNMAMSSLNPRDDIDAVVVAVQGVGGQQRLVYCPIGKVLNEKGGNATDFSLKWLGLQEGHNPGESYRQTAHCQRSNLFYTIFGEDGIQAYDLENDRERRFKIVLNFPMGHIQHALRVAAERRENATLKATHYEEQYYLVSLRNGDLLLLVRHRTSPYFKAVTHPYQTLHFDVFRVDMKRQELEKVDSLGDRAIFIGLNQSFDVWADGSDGLRPNCIYFSDDLSLEHSLYWGYDHGIFDMKDSRVLPLGCDQQIKAPFSRESHFWVVA